LSESRRGFSAIPAVEDEIDRLRPLTRLSLLNSDFTDSNIKESLSRNQFSVIHLATHGQFSSKAENTYLLTWDDEIGANEFSDLLSSTLREDRPVELLVMSACQTATGDDRAALGLAGIAVRAGARSTIASLWSVNDVATADLMSELYTQLSTLEVSKAEALRQAQLALLRDPVFSHPYYWSAFVLVGNWL
jgi:CHAT domain-containing protein